MTNVCLYRTNLTFVCVLSRINLVSSIAKHATCTKILNNHVTYICKTMTNNYK